MDPIAGIADAEWSIIDTAFLSLQMHCSSGSPRSARTAQSPQQVAGAVPEIRQW